MEALTLEEILEDIVLAHKETQELTSENDYYSVDTTILADYNIPLNTPLEKAFELEIAKRLLKERNKRAEISGSIWGK